MASGDTLLVIPPLANEFFGTNPATPDQITAAVGTRPVLDFDASTQEYAVFAGVLPNHYSGGGLTVRVFGAMDTTNTGVKGVVLEAAFERIATGDALGAAGSTFASGQSAAITVNNTADNLFVGTLVFTDGAQMDSLAAGEAFRLRLTRDVADAFDDALGDFQLIGLEIRET